MDLYLDSLKEKVMEKNTLNPLEKFILSMGTILILITFKNINLSIFVGIVMGIILFFQKLSIKRVLLFFLPPLFFLIPTLLAQGIEFSPELSFKFPWEIFFRVIGAIISIAYFILTIKFKDIYYVGRQLKIPKIICELAVLMFNYLNIMYISYIKIKVAMESRNGFGSFKTIYRDVAYVFTKVFLNSYYSLKDQGNAMRSRGYDDELVFYPHEYKIEKLNILLIFSWFVILIIVSKVNL